MKSKVAKFCMKIQHPGGYNQLKPSHIHPQNLNPKSS